MVKESAKRLTVLLWMLVLMLAAAVPALAQGGSQYTPSPALPRWTEPRILWWSREGLAARYSPTLPGEVARGGGSRRLRWERPRLDIRDRLRKVPRPQSGTFRGDRWGRRLTPHISIRPRHGPYTMPPATQTPPSVLQWEAEVRGRGVREVS